MKIFHRLVLSTSLLCVFAAPVSAQKRDYQTGETVEYRKSLYPEVWEQGTFLRPGNGGHTAVIKQKPNQTWKNGFEGDFGWSSVRPVGGHKVTAPAAAPPEAAENPVKQTNDGPAAAYVGGNGPMSQEDVIGFVAARVAPGDPFNPRHDPVKAELVQEIKRRGLTFSYKAATAEGKAFHKRLCQYIGAGTEVTFPLRANYGAPTQQSYLMADWNMEVHGGVVDSVDNNRVVRHNESGAGGAGTLSLKADQTWVWQNPKGATLRGGWRPATLAEKGERGGDQVVLMQAKGGWDWIVYRDNESGIPNRVEVVTTPLRGMKEWGARAGR